MIILGLLVLRSQFGISSGQPPALTAENRNRGGGTLCLYCIITDRITFAVVEYRFLNHTKAKF